MGITAKELARKLNISAAAVSMALNNKAGVSTQTRKMIIEEAKKEGYDFSRIQAKQESKQEYGTIYFVIFRKHGTLVPDSPVYVHKEHGRPVAEPAFFSQLSEGISLSCKEQNYHLNISYFFEDDDVNSRLQEWKNAKISGIVLLGTEIDKHDLIPFINSGIPFVLLDNYFEDLHVNSVITNNVQGAFSATNYLIRKKHSQPGYLRSSYRNVGFEERADGFYKAIRRNGMSASRSLVHDLSPTIDGAYGDMKEVLMQEGNTKLTDCYFADNDLIAVGAMRAFMEAGYRVPEDISIVGFDDMPLCTYVTPALTTVHVPKQYMGDVAVKRLVEIIKNSESRPVKIEVITSLIKRKSC